MQMSESYAALLAERPAGLPVGDGWVPVAGSQTVRFPYDGTPVADAPVGDAALATRAIDAAVGVRRAVARLTTGARRTILARVAGEIDARRAELVDLLIAETGKPRVDCQTEVDRTHLTWSLAAEEPARLHGETVPVDLLPSGAGLTGYFTRRPAGVVVGIAGFNYPLLLASHKLAPAIAAGGPVIVKPAPATPLATLWLVRAVRGALAAAAPAASVQLVTGGVEVGVALTTDSRVAVVSFTGSAAVGHAIARAAAPRRVVLELGSNSALVVCADGNLEAAADAVIRGGYYASGQACISVQRVLVEAPVADEFTALLAGAMGQVVAGDPRDPATRVSALINDAATERVLGWVGQARHAGAAVRTGGGRSGTVLEPTLLTDVPSGLPAWDEEIFGPVVMVRTVPDVEAALAAVNDSRYGLHASVFTSSLATAHRAIAELEVGGVVINEVPGFRSDVMPYGGVKDSGIGREGPRWAVEEFTVTRMATIRPEP
jgi:acyl-CoA reductase-like NAD-dependent aldehyde dehydrogenase